MRLPLMPAAPDTEANNVWPGVAAICAVSKGCVPGLRRAHHAIIGQLLDDRLRQRRVCPAGASPFRVSLCHSVLRLF
jgi:hypothetical protein